MKAEEFLKEQGKKIKPLQKQLHLAYWDAALSGKKEDYNKLEKIQVEIEKIFNNKEDFEKIKEIMKEDGHANLEINRQLKILYDAYLGSQGDINLLKEIIRLSTEIENEFNTFRAKVAGKELTDNDIKKILKTEKDSEKLREFWEASKMQGEIVEKKILELVRLRNKLAKSLGFENYYSMALELQEQDEKEVENIFQEMRKLTEKPFKELKKEMDSILAERYEIPKEELRPWHYQELFFQEGPEIFKIDFNKFYRENILEKAKEFYGNLELPVEDILERSDLYEKPGKYQHACCMDMDREGDVRIIQNIKNNERWMDTTLHELGHAVYCKFISPELPYFLRDAAHTLTTEAIALFFGRNSKNLSFIKKYCDVEEKETEKLEKETIKASRLKQLVFSRWSQVMFNFERELYKNPEQNLNELWWNLVKKHQLLDFSRNKPDWAAKIHIAHAPVYYHNYFLGELLASQINHYIVKNILKENSLNNVDYSHKEVGDYLKDKIFSVGSKFIWNEMIEKATGEKLTPKYFVEQFVER